MLISHLFGVVSLRSTPFNKKKVGEEKDDNEGGEYPKDDAAIALEQLNSVCS